MNHFIREAFFVGTKQGCTLLFCTALLSSFFRDRGYAELRKPLFAGLLVVFLLSFLVMSVPVAQESRDFPAKLAGFTFGLCYLFSLAALFHDAGTDLPRPLKSFFQGNHVLFPVVFLLTIAYFFPDVMGSSLYLEELAAMSGQHGALFAWAGAGFLITISASYLIVKHLKLGGNIMRLFGLAQVLLVLALVKLVAGGVRGFAEWSLIPTVQAGLMKAIHDIVHQTLILVLIPDHPLLTMTAWKYIGLLFGDTLALWLALVVFTAPLFLFLKRHFSEAVNIPHDLTPGARTRSFIKSARDERVRKSVPVFVFMLFIVITWFSHKGDAGSLLEKPEPVPMVVTGDTLILPLQTPTEDLLDGAMHKFSVTANGEVIRLLVIKKTDNRLAVCLDACGLCPPEGYGRARNQVVCIYCRTPIPVDTLGQAGGCNPVPLVFQATDKDVRITIAEITGKWAMVKTGSGSAKP